MAYMSLFTLNSISLKSCLHLTSKQVTINGKVLLREADNKDLGSPKENH